MTDLGIGLISAGFAAAVLFVALASASEDVRGYLVDSAKIRADAEKSAADAKARMFEEIKREGKS